MADYAVYKGDDLLVFGSLQECAEELEVKSDTIRYYTTPVHKKRTKNSDNNMIAIKIEEDDLE